MTRVDFYSNTRDKLEVARRLIGKSRDAGKCVLVRARDARLADALDAYLWTHPPLSFLPHVRADHPRARQTPIVIGDDPDVLGSPDVLINLEADTPGYFARFDRLLEIIGEEADEIQAGRQRYRFYKERGYELRHNDMTGK
jgi:DNA polymerase-3 subunit chi